MKWGLPSAERNRLILGEDRRTWRAPEIPLGEAADPWSAYPNYLSDGPQRTGTVPRNAFNPVRSYHPDEYVILKSLSGMHPSELKLFHGFFGWPALQIYVVGAALKAASWVGLAHLVLNMDYYFANPEEMARLYWVGRTVTLIFALACLVVVWMAASRLFGPAGGLAAALLLAVTPVFVINAHYMTGDIPMLFWVSVVLFLSTYILRGSGMRAYLAAGVALGLAAATRYQGALAAFLIVAAHIARPREDPATEQRRGVVQRRALSVVLSRHLWIATLVSIGIFLLANPYVVVHPAKFVQELAGELRGSHADISRLAGTLLITETGLGMLLAFASLGALWLLIVRPVREGFFVLAGFGIPAVLLLAGSPAMARYLMPALLLPIFLMAYAFALVHTRGMDLRRPGLRWLQPLCWRSCCL